MLENRTKPEETRETIREGETRFSRKRHSHRLVLQAHLDLAEDTGEEEEEEDDERPDREITPSSITLSLFLVPESEPRNRRKPTAFEILSCSGRFVQGSAVAPAERAHPSPKEGKEQRRKRERQGEGEGTRRERKKKQEKRANACCAVRSTATAANGCIECRPASRRLKIDGRRMQQPRSIRVSTSSVG